MVGPRPGASPSAPLPSTIAGETIHSPLGQTWFQLSFVGESLEQNPSREQGRGAGFPLLCRRVTCRGGVGLGVTGQRCNMLMPLLAPVSRQFPHIF